MRSGRRGGGAQAMMPGNDDDPDLDAALQPLAGKPPSAQQIQAMAVLQQMLGGQPIQRQPLQVLQALIERQKNPAKLTLPAEEPRAIPVPDEPPQSPNPGDDSRGVPDEEGAAPAATSPLAVRILTGDWKEIKTFVGDLPKEMRADVYGGLLTMLAADPRGVILPQEILSLAGASPGPLDDRNLAQLGQLVRRSLQQSEKPGDLLAALEAGTPQLGGKDADRRLAAAKLLLAAGLVAEATPYLPPLDAALAAKDAPAINIHSRQKYLLGRQKNDAAQLLRAWELTQIVLDLPAAKELHPVCIRRTLAMTPQIPREVASKWFQRVFKEDPAAGMALLVDVAQRLSMAFMMNDDAQRGNALRVQQLAGTELLAVRGDDLGEWSVALEMLTRGWLHEAQKAAGGTLQKITVERDEQVEPLAIPVLLETAPGAAWQKAVGRDTADHIRHLIGLFAARTGQQPAALAIIGEIVSRNPDLARQLAEELLKAGQSTEEEVDGWERYGISPSMRRQLTASQRAYYAQQIRAQRSRQSSSREPLTRAGQLRSLAKMKELLVEFQKLGVPPLSEEARVEAFASCHSSAEVYLAEDIERIFGPAKDLTPESALKLGQALREGLAQAWRDPEVQSQQGTRRTPKEQAAEVIRGYALATGLLEEAARRAPERAELQAMLGGAHFDLAEFLYGQQADLKTYAAQRDAAFRAFARGVAAYDKSLPTLPKEKQEVEVFRQWFQAALGTSDFSYLTKQDEPDKTQVQKIANALTGLHVEAPHHQELFAQAIVSSLDQVPPALKPHLVRQALVVIGKHPAAKPLVERLAAYDDLLKEVELRLRIDGSNNVGHGRPFGVHVSLAGTRAVLRENDAFPTLLISNAAIAASMGQPGQEADPRQRLENELRDKLSQAFQIETLVFHPPQTKQRSFGREGWQELPLAYVVLRAKDEAVDRIPPAQFDLEFSDGDGQVRLPVRSQVVLLDARAKSPPLRPSREVKVRQLLDDREITKGNVRLEIVATARGLVPELDQLLKEPGQIPGFEVKQSAEQGLSVASLEAGENIEALTERRWLIELTPASESPPDSFAFPQAADAAFVVTNQRYDDADIVDAGATTPLRWPAIHSVGRWLWPAASVVAVVLAAIALFVFLRLRKPAQVAARVYSRPPQLTPFTLIGLLQRMHADAALRLTPGQQQDLSSTIDKLESQFFSRGETAPDADLDGIATLWLTRV